MGVILRHSIKISAAPERVFQALTDPAQMSSWHHGTIEGEVATGSVLYLESKPGLRFGWETKQLVAGERIVQECVEGPGSSAGKTLQFSLTDLGSGSTQVDLSDGEWDENDSSLPHCNTHWGGILHQLKSYVEG